MALTAYCTALMVVQSGVLPELALAQLVTQVTVEQVARFQMHAQPLLTQLKMAQMESSTV